MTLADSLCGNPRIVGTMVNMGRHERTFRRFVVVAVLCVGGCNLQLKFTPKEPEEHSELEWVDLDCDGREQQLQYSEGVSHGLEIERR